MGFAQHQSFYIRSNWIAKGLESLNSDGDNDFFSDKENHLILGIGKNMFASLRFWLVCSGLADVVGKKHLVLSRFGKVVKEYDSSCLDNSTLSIIHYEISSSQAMAETWYWFFNVFPEFSAPKESVVFENLKKWAEANEARVSEKTLHRDLDTMLQFYTSKENVNDPEDVIFSNFSRLNLIEEVVDRNNTIIIKNSPKPSVIGLPALMFVLLDYCKKNGSNILTVDDIISKPRLWGKTFNMKKPDIMDALNRLSLQKYDSISFNRTNQLDTIVCPDIDPIDYLESYYMKGK